MKIIEENFPIPSFYGVESIADKKEQTKQDRTPL